MIVLAKKIHLVSPEDCYPFDPPGRQSLDGRILDRFAYYRHHHPRYPHYCDD
jgi:hypothetical protein